MVKNGKKKRGAKLNPRLFYQGRARKWLNADTTWTFHHSELGAVEVHITQTPNGVLIRCGQGLGTSLKEYGILAFPKAVLCVAAYVVLVVLEVDHKKHRVRVSTCNFRWPVPALSKVMTEKL